MSQPVAEVGGYKNITATGAVTPGPCQLIGFYVNSTTIGTLVLRNGGAGGDVMSGTSMMSSAGKQASPLRQAIPAPRRYFR